MKGCTGRTRSAWDSLGLANRHRRSRRARCGERSRFAESATGDGGALSAVYHTRCLFRFPPMGGPMSDEVLRSNHL